MKKSLLIKSSAVVLALGVAAGVAAGAYSLKAVEAKAVDEVCYDLVIADTTNNGYNYSGTVTIDDVEWNVEGNGQISPWRLGGKNISNVDRRVYSSSAVTTKNVSKVELQVGAANSITVNSLSLKVGSDTTFADYEVPATFSSNSTITFERPNGADWSNMCFAFVFNVSVSGSTNRFVQFSGAKFYETLASGVQAVIDAIDAIGTVEYTPECKALIDQARALYDELSDDDKALVTNYSTLTAAEDAYDTLAAAHVDDLIDAIGEITSYTQISEVVAAREAYEALSDAQKAKVTKLDVLVAAEEAIARITPSSEQLIVGENPAGGEPIWTNGVVTESVSVGDVTFSYFGSGNDGKFYVSDNTWRFYNADGGVKITVPATHYILEVELEWASTKFAPKTPDGFIANEGSTVFVADSGHKSNEVSFFRGTAGQTLFKSFKVYYAVNTDPVISLTGLPTTLDKGDTGVFAPELQNATNPVVTWTSSNPDVLAVNASTGAYEALAPGKATINAELTCDEGSAAASISINVNAGLISIAEALEISAGLADKATTDYSVTVKGYIVNLDETAKKQFVISDVKTGSTGNTLVIYGIYEQDVVRNYAIKNGEITFKGQIQNYGGLAELKNPQVVDYIDDAMVYAKESYESLQEACEVGVDAVSQGDWDDLRDNYDALDEFAQAKLSASSAEYAYSEDIAKWYVRYSKIVAGAGYENFMNIEIASVKTSSVIKDNKVMIITVCAVAASLLLVGGLFFFRKKKENN